MPNDRELKLIRKTAKRLQKQNATYKDKTLKVAFCFSGQLRTWRKCIHTWQELFEDLKEKHNVTNVDIFCHIWDHNTLQQGIANEKVALESLDTASALSRSEISDYITQLAPVAYKIDNVSVSKSKKQQIEDQALFECQFSGEFKHSWMAPQFYSIMYTGHLKRMHEIKNQFNYDICVRMRNDMYLNKDFRNNFSIDEMLRPTFNTIHACHSGIDDKGPWFKRRLGDIFWYADSPTFDKLSNFYQWLPAFGTRALDPVDLAPEHIFYYYAKMFNISINPKPIHYITIARDAEYVKNKKDAGLGPLGGFEILC